MDDQADLTKITPPKELSALDKHNVFEHFFRHLASYRNTAQSYSAVECDLDQNNKRKESFNHEINKWAQSLLERAWVVCHDSGKGQSRPNLHIHLLKPYTHRKLADTSTRSLQPLPPIDALSKILTTILFLDITISTLYSARTRTFLSSLGTPDEPAIVAALKNPERAISSTAAAAAASRDAHAVRGHALRTMGVGLGAIAGGVLIGVTGGLAAPLVGAGVTAVLGWLGVGGTIVGLLASGLAGSSVVCGALFGAYGAQESARMVERYTREVRDLEIVRVREPGEGEKKEKETLGVRLCVSGWLTGPGDVTAPWEVFQGDETFALQWVHYSLGCQRYLTVGTQEMQALEDLSNALMTLLKSQAMTYVQAEVIRRTVLSSLMTSLAPLVWLKIGQIIGLTSFNLPTKILN